MSVRSRRAGIPREQARLRPLYARILGLQFLNPSGFLCFVYFEGAIALGVLLALAELVSWWGVLVLPLTVAAMVKLNDVVAGALTPTAGAALSGVRGGVSASGAGLVVRPATTRRTPAGRSSAPGAVAGSARPVSGAGRGAARPTSGAGSGGVAAAPANSGSNWRGTAGVSTSGVRQVGEGAGPTSGARWSGKEAPPTSGAGWGGEAMEPTSGAGWGGGVAAPASGPAQGGEAAGPASGAGWGGGAAAPTSGPAQGGEAAEPTSGAGWGGTAASPTSGGGFGSGQGAGFGSGEGAGFGSGQGAGFGRAAVPPAAPAGGGAHGFSDAPDDPRVFGVPAHDQAPARPGARALWPTSGTGPHGENDAPVNTPPATRTRVDRDDQVDNPQQWARQSGSRRYQ